MKKREIFQLCRKMTGSKKVCLTQGEERGEDVDKYSPARGSVDIFACFFSTVEISTQERSREGNALMCSN